MARRHRQPGARNRVEAERACGAKTRYPSGRLAAQEAQRFGMSYYPCMRCRGWHLTRGLA